MRRFRGLTIYFDLLRCMLGLVVLPLYVEVRQDIQVEIGCHQFMALVFMKPVEVPNEIVDTISSLLMNQ